MTEANPVFTCQTCGQEFTLPAATLAKYPNWTPKQCLKCRKGGTTHAGAAEENLPVAQVLDKYTAGPQTGVFTDGGCTPNPGPGGWGAVYVIDGEVVAEAHGQDEATTNNRMELTALSHGIDLVPVGTAATIYSDSNLCVQTMNEWAKGWEAKGWKRKKEPIKNLELVQEVYYKLQKRPELTLEWIKAHNGFRWNEYADSLATAWQREEL